MRVFRRLRRHQAVNTEAGKSLKHHAEKPQQRRSKKAAEQCAAKEALKLLGVIKEK